MSAVNPYTPPRAAVSDREDASERFSEPKIWSASGRIGRVRYLAYLMVGYLVTLVAMLVLVGIAAAMATPALLVIAVFVSLIPYFVLSVLCAIQRAHDMNWTGWSVFLLLIPLVAFVWLFNPGTKGENRFGAPPPPNSTALVVSAWLVVGIPFIVGILAAISIPAYQDYVKRAKAVQQQRQPQPQQEQQ